MVVNKTELINRVAKGTGFTKKDTEVFLDSVFDVVAKAMISGEEVSIPHFGKFKTVIRAGRLGVNPQNTDERIEIPDKIVIKFAPSAGLKKDVLNA